MPAEACGADTSMHELVGETLGCVLLISGLILATGCSAVRAMTEEELVTPEQRVLEIIVVGDGTGPDACSMNFDEVGAATHPVDVIAEQGLAHVRILDHAGGVVFEADSGASEGSPGDGFGQ